MRDQKVSQHYVPRLHLRRFVNSPDSNSVYCYDKQNRRSFQTSIDSTATEDFFYDGKTKLVPEMEEFLEKLEKRVGKPYTKLVKEESISYLTEKERLAIALFLGVQMVRTRGSRSSMQGMVEGIEEKVGQENLTEEFKKELDEMKSEKSLRELQNNLIKDASSNFANIMMALDWHLFLNKTELPYYTSDFPVVKHNELDFGPYGNLGLRNKGIQIFFPLTPWMLLLIMEPSAYPDLPEVRNTTEQENVIFQRDLQVQRSNRFVYSYQDDFEQAERRIETTPEIAEPLSKRANVE